MRILVALDESDFSKAVTNMLIAQMKASGTEVRLLHVVEPLPVKLAAAAGSREYPDFIKARIELRERAQTRLEEAATRLRDAGFTVTHVIQEGDPRVVILDEAAAWNATLIVMGSHGRTGVQRWLMGSVSEAVARHATCSVEIVRTDAIAPEPQ